MAAPVVKEAGGIIRPLRADHQYDDQKDDAAAAMAAAADAEEEDDGDESSEYDVWDGGGAALAEDGTSFFPSLTPFPPALAAPIRSIIWPTG